MLLNASMRTRAPGGTTQVESYSSMMSGPDLQPAPSAAREMTGVSAKPSDLPKYARLRPCGCSWPARAASAASLP